MHIHIHQMRVAIDKQGHRRMSIPRQEVGVGPAQSPKQQLVLHGPPVDEQILRDGRATRIGRQRGIARQAKPFTLGIDLQGVLGKIRPNHPRQTPVQGIKQIALLGVGAKGNPPLAATRDIAQHEPHRRLSHRQPFHHVANRLRLGPIRAHEFQPRRGRVKQIAQLNHRTLRQRGGLRG